ncbi:MAG: aldo/keto reductase [Acidimicrobiaceae bacterium]|nr:aldo/keto reductase [Acidimicrobiaceae bacterium]
MSEDRPAIGRASVGGTSLEMTRLVFGTGPLGGLFAPVDATSAAESLEAAWAVGVRAYDTAPHYGAGMAEERLGAFLRDKPRQDVVVSSKVGRLLVPTDDDVEGVEGFYGTPRRKRVRDYSRDGVRRSIEQSCERLGLDRVDIALIHDPDDYEQVAVSEAYPALHELRDEGTVTAIGVGMNQVAMVERFVRDTDLDCVLIAGRYSLLNATAADTLFPLCEAKGVSVLVGGVYNSGILADPSEGATYDYAPAPREVLERVEAIRAVCARYGVALPAAALHFVLANPAVTAAIVGARSALEVRENAGHLDARVPSELFDELASAGLVPFGGDIGRR